MLLLYVKPLQLLLDLLRAVVLEWEELSSEVGGGFVQGGGRRLSGASEVLVPWHRRHTLLRHLDLIER